MTRKKRMASSSSATASSGSSSESESSSCSRATSVSQQNSTDSETERKPRRTRSGVSSESEDEKPKKKGRSRNEKSRESPRKPQKKTKPVVKKKVPVSVPPGKRMPLKNVPKQSKQTSNNKGRATSKKIKSIFSPDNSSESDTEQKPKSKQTPRKGPRSRARRKEQSSGSESDQKKVTPPKKARTNRAESGSETDSPTKASVHRVVGRGRPGRKRQTQTPVKPPKVESTDSEGQSKRSTRKVTATSNARGRNTSNRQRVDNSSESEAEEVKPKRGGRTRGGGSSTKKTKPPPKAVDSEPSTATSTTASSESSSESETEQSADSPQRTRSPKKQSNNNKAAVITQAVARKKAQVRPTPREKTAASSESDTGKTEPPKKLTRSSSGRKNKVTATFNHKESDSDSEADTAVAKAPRKRNPGKAPARRGRKKKARELEIRLCPVSGCESRGHLGGFHQKHSTPDACPVYHHLTPEECKSLREERKMEDKERHADLEAFGSMSPKPDQTEAQMAYEKMIRENRKVMSEKPKHVIESKDPDSRPLLYGKTCDYDLKLFEQAVCEASEKMEKDILSLPPWHGLKYIEMGKYQIEAWYYSPYPEEFGCIPKLYLCEFCLKYMKSATVLRRHAYKCVWRHPPGDEIYRRDRMSVWEVDGTNQKSYCINLCLLAKLFLDHKTLYYDVEPFLFYVMTIADSEGCHLVGYFSKEKNSFLNYNVSCIMTLPPYQRQGYGRLLIDFSYLLTREENKIGSPERPLSDLGLISYRSYWKDVVLGFLCDKLAAGKDISVKDLSAETAIHSNDLVSTLQAMGLMKYWKGQHIIIKHKEELEEFMERVKRRPPDYKKIERTCLRWRPFQVKKGPK